MRQITILTAGLASTLALSLACTSPGKKTAIGAGTGAAAGAAAGAIVGHQTGNRGKGALIGAALGGAGGGLIGNRLDQQAKELESIAETQRTDEGILTKLKSDFLFATGKSDLRPAAIGNLKKMAAILKKYPENVLTIKGYTDSTGSENVNLPLSENRADAVRAMLVSNGVPAKATTSAGMGENQPVASNETVKGRAQNRRVEVEITVDESKLPR